MIKDIIILTKSTKHYPDYCVAGIDIKTGKWVRPISSSGIEGAVRKGDILYEDGTEVAIFDIVRINFIEYAPNTAQNENYLYDETIYWEKVGKANPDEIIDKYLQNIDYIFENNKKELTDNEIDGTSLLLVRIENPIVSITTYPERKNITIKFTYKNNNYRYIKISDQTLINQFLRNNDGQYPLGKYKYAVFSITGKYIKTGKYYKMLAQLF